MDGTVVTDPKHIASAFNRYFVNVPPNKLIKQFQEQRNHRPIDYLQNRNGHSIFLTATDSLETETIIMTFNNSKSVGPYSIPMRLLESLGKPVSEAFSLIVNDTLSNGTYPSKLKVGKVVALHKKGASDNPSNYRPISLSSVFSKIIGKLMHKRLYDFLEIHNVTAHCNLVFRRSILQHMHLLVLLKRLNKLLMMEIMAVVFLLI